MSIQNIDISKTCCFSGHRPHKFSFRFDRSEREFIELENNILNAILKSVNEGYNTFLCGGAMGFDLLCGETVILIKNQFPNIRLISVIAFEGQNKSFSPEWAKRYEDVLKNSDIIHIVCKAYHKGAYHMRNLEMINSSSRVIACFNGSAGGTANTISLAKKKNLDILNVPINQDKKPLPDITYYFGRL